MNYDVTSLRLAKTGRKRIDWAARQMGVLQDIQKRFRKTQPLRGQRIACCLHVTAETAVLAQTLKIGGASVVVCASNPLSTQDETAAALVTDFKIPVYARRGENRSTYYRHLNSALDTKPTVTMDDGADLVSLLHAKRSGQAKSIKGSTEETTTGVIRLKSMEADGVLKFPVIAVNDSKTKHFFDNRYGTGQSTIDGILRSTNILIAGKSVVVAGYGFCGKGVAARAHGMGARVIVTEVDPVRALEAHLDGFDVMPMREAAALGDVFVTVTGDASVIRFEHVRRMKDGAIIGNSGHFDVEIDIRGMAAAADEITEVRPMLKGYRYGRRTIFVIGDGRLLNLAAAEGHPAAVMDMSFANQALAAEYITNNSSHMERRVYTLPDEIDHQIASLKLETLGVGIDRLTPAQRQYLASWKAGT